MKTIQLFNRRANAVQDAEISHVTGEWVATFADGHFVKFPFTTDMDELRAMIAKHNADNVPHVTAEDMQAQDDEANALLAEL